MSTTLHMTAPGAHTHTHSHSHSHSHTHTLSLSLSAMSAQPQFSRPTVRYYQAAAVAVLSVLCVLALAVRADVPSAQRTLGRRQQYTPKLSCLGAVLMAQSSIQDKLSWTFTPPPMVPSGRTIQIGSLVILATRSGLAWRAWTTALSLNCTCMPIRLHITHSIQSLAELMMIQWWWWHWTVTSPTIKWVAPFHHRLVLSWIFSSCTSIQWHPHTFILNYHQPDSHIRYLMMIQWFNDSMIQWFNDADDDDIEQVPRL